MIRGLVHAGIAAVALAAPALSEGLDVTVSGLRAADGNVLIFVFDAARAFDQLDVWRSVGFAEIPARTGTVRHRFGELNRGPYAVFLFHDENGDEELDSSAGRLLEGVGASGAHNPDAEPDFAAASIWPGSVNVRVHYDQ